jgi:hypothetical protein
MPPSGRTVQRPTTAHPLSSDAPLNIGISFERQTAFRENLCLTHQVNAAQSGVG